MANIIELSSTESVNVLVAAKLDKVKVKHLCKRAICGKCTMKVLEGDISEPNVKEIKKLGQEKIDAGFRLSCQTTFTGKLKIEQ
ncbi:MAG: 2Fe-2S iron-sulfur cluster binding domain-containing protein [Spirochaetaceae bacterium]